MNTKRSYQKRVQKRAGVKVPGHSGRLQQPARPGFNEAPLPYDVNQSVTIQALNARLATLQNPQS
jgi:hypothetical protein